MTREEKAAYDREYRARNAERIAANKRAYVEANREQGSARVRAWVEANRERSNEIKRAWKERNPEHDKQYRTANAERIAVVRAEYREANRELLSAKQCEYAQRPENKERIADWHREYRARRPEVHRTTARLRRHGVSHATPPWADKVAIKAIYAEARAKGLHVDHIVPLKSNHVCGLHVETNLQLLTPEQNRRKGNRYAD